GDIQEEVEEAPPQVAGREALAGAGRREGRDQGNRYQDPRQPTHAASPRPPGLTRRASAAVDRPRGFPSVSSVTTPGCSGVPLAGRREADRREVFLHPAEVPAVAGEV